MTAILLPGQNTSLPSGTPLLIRFDMLKLPPNYEIDSCAFVLNSRNKVRSDTDFVFFNQPIFCAGILQKHASGHEFFVNPPLLPEDVRQVVFSLSLYDGANRRQNFSSISECTGEVISANSREKIATFSLNTLGMTESALLFFALYRNNGQWKLRALGNGFIGGLDALATHFGVDVNEGENAPGGAATESNATDSDDESDQKQIANAGKSPASPPPMKATHESDFHRKRNPFDIAKMLLRLRRGCRHRLTVSIQRHGREILARHPITRHSVDHLYG